MLLALGSVEETAATWNARRPWPPAAGERRHPRRQVSAQADHRARLQRAEDLFTGALRSDPAWPRPGCGEAGCGSCSGRPARREPTSRRPRSGRLTRPPLPGPPHAGQVQGEAERWPEAEAAFAAASSLFPQAPSALVALSHAQLRQGAAPTRASRCCGPGDRQPARRRPRPLVAYPGASAPGRRAPGRAPGGGRAVRLLVAAIALVATSASAAEPPRRPLTFSGAWRRSTSTSS